MTFKLFRLTEKGNSWIQPGLGVLWNKYPRERKDKRDNSAFKGVIIMMDHEICAASGEG